MRNPLLLLLTTPLALCGCAVGLNIAGIATSPLDRKGQFEEIQGRYTSDIRFGMFEDALAVVEPEHKPRFEREMERMRGIRFSDHRIERIEYGPNVMRATATVRYRGYWLSSPFEREVRVTQQWRREAPSQRWYVTPDFDQLIDPPGS